MAPLTPVVLNVLVISTLYLIGSICDLDPVGNQNT